MPDTQSLHIALQDGFYQDTVRIQVDGKEMAVRSDVTTKPQIGLAGMIDLQVPPGKISLRVSVAGKPSSEALTIDLSQSLHVGVSLDGAGQIVYTRSDKPFRYA